MEALRQDKKVAEAAFPLIITDSLLISEAELAVKTSGEGDDVTHTITFPHALDSPPSLDGAASLQVGGCVWGCVSEEWSVKVSGSHARRSHLMGRAGDPG